MTEVPSSVGGIAWDRMRTGIDGEQISLMIPALFESHNVPYLEGVLASRFDELFQGDDIPFALNPGKIAVDGHGHYFWEVEGSVVITGISEPWPNGGELRTVLEEAFEEAAAVEAEQLKRAEALELHLRATGSRDNAAD